jgi:hypothetical protein
MQIAGLRHGPHPTRSPGGAPHGWLDQVGSESAPGAPRLPTDSESRRRRWLAVAQLSGWSSPHWGQAGPPREIAARPDPRHAPGATAAAGAPDTRLHWPLQQECWIYGCSWSAAAAGPDRPGCTLFSRSRRFSLAFRVLGPCAPRLTGVSALFKWRPCPVSRPADYEYSAPRCRAVSGPSPSPSRCPADGFSACRFSVLRCVKLTPSHSRVAADPARVGVLPTSRPYHVPSPCPCRAMAPKRRLVVVLPTQPRAATVSRPLAVSVSVSCHGPRAPAPAAAVLRPRHVSKGRAPPTPPGRLPECRAGASMSQPPDIRYPGPWGGGGLGYLFR